jgi:hypothetical protein
MSSLACVFILNPGLDGQKVSYLSRLAPLWGSAWLGFSKRLDQSRLVIQNSSSDATVYPDLSRSQAHFLAKITYPQTYG